MTAGQDDPRVDHFLVKLDRMVNEDRIDDPREVRAALDEAQATIRRLRASGGVTAGQDEPDELRGLIHDALQTVVEAVTELRQVNPGDLGADELDAARRKLIRARAIADRVAAAPAVDTAAAADTAGQDPLRAPVEALLAAWEDLTVVATTLDERVAEVRRHLDEAGLLARPASPTQPPTDAPTTTETWTEYRVADGPQPGGAHPDERTVTAITRERDQVEAWLAHWRSRWDDARIESRTRTETAWTEVQ